MHSRCALNDCTVEGRCIIALIPPSFEIDRGRRRVQHSGFLLLCFQDFIFSAVRSSGTRPRKAWLHTASITESWTRSFILTAPSLLPSCSLKPSLEPCAVRTELRTRGCGAWRDEWPPMEGWPIQRLLANRHGHPSQRWRTSRG